MHWLTRVFGAVLGKRPAIFAGNLNLTGPKSPIEIFRDSAGVPHIYAQTESDAWFALGFCQGQDRCFQIEMLVRASRGQLSEILGKRALGADLFSRRIGLHRASKEQWKILDETSRDTIETFVAGLNEGCRTGLTARPHEYALLRTDPIHFEPTDPVAILGLMCLFLPSNWDSELTRLKVWHQDGPEALKSVDHSLSSLCIDLNQKILQTRWDMSDTFIHEVKALQEFVGMSGGSNNWALRSELTESGRPILASDPHLGPMLPAQWYLSHVTAPGWSAVGASLAGTPGFAIGHNGKAAWGATAGMVDNADLFIERLGDDALTVLENDGYGPCKSVEETIRVRGQKDVSLKVLVTPRGPIISESISASEFVLSIQATWLQPRSIAGMLKIHRAQNFSEFRQSFNDWASLPLNYVYADSENHIGYQLVGLLPERKKGRGMIPLPGWAPDVGWKERLKSYDELPTILDPSFGFVASANTDPPVPGFSGFVTGDWYDSFRFNRIWEVLSSKKRWTLAECTRLQMDQFSIPWREVKEVLLPVLSGKKDLSRLADLLTHWDGIVSAKSPGATAYECLIRALTGELVRLKAPNSHFWILGKGYGGELLPHNMFGACRVGWLVRLLRDRPEGFIEEGWSDLISRVALETQASLVDKFGEDVSRWAWGKVRPLELIHPFGTLKLFRPIFNRGPFPWGGDLNTVGQTASDPNNLFKPPVAMANLRMVVDVGGWENSTFVLAGGQSGNPLSPHYDDLLELWKKGESVSIAYSRSRVLGAAKSKLVLTPKTK